jgi:hypothetical protein
MARILGLGSLLLTAALAGCASGPVPYNPLLVQPELPPTGSESNPLWIPQRPEAYAIVFDRTYDVVHEFFNIAYSNRFAGEIHTWPLVTAGYFDAFGLRLGYYDCYENTESTLQSVRRRAIVIITPADSGGYYIDVQVLKELEDLPRPAHANAGAVLARTDNPIERPMTVVDPTIFSQGWIPFGRDHALERLILSRLRECL